MRPAACSVVVPTHNRREILAHCLARLAAQTVGADRLEVIVVDDGSTDDTETVVSRLGPPFGSFTYLRQANAGPAAARNRGLARATAPITLFANDDTLLDPGAVEAHLDAHADRRQVLVLGAFDLRPDFRATPLGHLLQHTPHLFQYCLLEPGDDADWNFAYTCNLSLPTADARRTGFDERFTGPAAEDVDFGLRLFREGWCVHYRPEAAAVHDHVMDVAGLARTARARGRGQAVLYAKHGLTSRFAERALGTAPPRAEVEAVLAAGVDRLEVLLAAAGDVVGGPLPDACYEELSALMVHGTLLGFLEPRPVAA